MKSWMRIVAPHTSDEQLERFVGPFHLVFDDYDITRPDRIAMFLAQVSHESGGFRYTEENLNYSKSALLRVFGKYFDNRTAEIYARNPDMIANRVYANRMDNGPEESGDGWKYRGKGLIQVTGKYNHQQFANDFGLTLDEAIDYLKTDEGAAFSAGWYWGKHRLNDYVPDVREVTRRINGGYNGLADREQKYNKLYHHIMRG